jgi:23S rRNA pseudouridine2605 synthase
LSLPTDESGIRLNRYMARCGAGSRRASDGLVSSGAVTINGHPADSPGIRVHPGDVVEVRGRRLTLPELVTAAFNKPLGMEVTLAGGCRTLAGVLSGLPPGCVPVGRLDVNTGGLLILTNDGELAFRLAHPRWGVQREYLLSLESTPPDQVLARLRRGSAIGGGDVCRPVTVERSGPLGLRIVLTTGRNREVRRLAEVAGLALAGLERLRYGPVRLGSLPRGRVKVLRGRELHELYSCVSLDGGHSEG